MANAPEDSDAEETAKRNAAIVEGDRQMRAAAEEMQKQAKAMMDRSREIIQNAPPPVDDDK